MDMFWNNFSITGSVEAYLAYKAMNEILDGERGGRGGHVQGQGTGIERIPGGGAR